MTYTVLIIDDDDLNREVMEAYLSIHGHTALIAGSGRKALELAESKLPDLIILDVRLPDMSGIDVCKSLKANPTTSHIPIMMITGLTDRQVRDQAYEAGVDLFFPRPFEGDQFATEVNRLLASEN